MGPAPPTCEAGGVDSDATESGHDEPESRDAGLPRRIELPDGRTIVVRLVREGDAAGLHRLYEQLSDEDRYRRFFSMHRPHMDFFERLATIADRGGAAVVVEDLAGVDTPIVAEASYEPLANGNGEMAIVVHREWRGWLGPYLVGVLAAVAAARGVPNLEAEVLTINRPMRAVMRNRGEAFLPGSSWESVRVESSTTGRAPGWFATDRPKVLLEMRSPPFDVLERLADEYEVVACTGPTGRPRPCPMLAGHECPLASGADAIVIAMPRDDTRDELVTAHHRHHPDVPVELFPPEQRAAGCDRLADAVERALARSGRDAPPSGDGSNT